MIGQVGYESWRPATGEAAAYLGGHLATGLAETRNDAAALDEPGWWAVVLSYEGTLVAARFEHVRRAPHPRGCWPGVAPNTWSSSTDREQYVVAVEEIRARIARGDVYQANLC